MERPRSMPRYSASRLAGIAAAVLSCTATLPNDASESERAALLSTTSSAKRTRFLLPRRAFSRFILRFSEARTRTLVVSGGEQRPADPRPTVSSEGVTGGGEARAETRRRLGGAVGVGLIGAAD
jgi:hypothetical protein